MHACRGVSLSVVVLADEQPFALGDLTVRPALRQIVCADGAEHILEPKVMQVLVALAKAQGGIVSRDKLIEQCWEGRIVGEDAINRVIGRLRQFAHADAANAFRIDTVPRVGYRLIARGQPEPQTIAPMVDPADPLPIEPPSPTVPDRRALLIGAGTAVVVAAGGAAWWFTRPSPPPATSVSPKVYALFLAARDASRRATPDGVAESQALFKQLLQIAPDYADAWGALAMSYSYAAHTSRTPEADTLQANAAISRALRLDPHNRYALGAKALLFPRRGHWIEQERIVRDGLRYHPGDSELLFVLANVLCGVGLLEEAARALDAILQGGDANDPGFRWFHIQSLWAANRLQDADAAAVEAMRLYPRQIYVWWSQFYLLLFTGRADQAHRLAADVDARPPGVPDADFERFMQVSAAIASGAKADKDKAAAALLEAAHKGGGYAENAIMTLPMLDHVDDAFTVAYGTFFDRGFEVGQLRFSAEQRTYTPQIDRKTRPLFLPSTKAMRRDPRFLPLMAELKITDYWKTMGVKPDYQTGGDG